MAEDTIGLPADGPGKKLDTFRYTHTTSGAVHRERPQIAGIGEDDVCVVTDTDPGASDRCGRPLPARPRLRIPTGQARSDENARGIAELFALKVLDHRPCSTSGVVELKHPRNH